MRLGSFASCCADRLAEVARCPARGAARNRSGSRRRCPACRACPSCSRARPPCSLAHTLDGLHVLARIGGLRADVEREPLHLDAELRGEPRQLQRDPQDRSRTCATGRTPRRGCGTTPAATAARGRAMRANLRTSSGLSATKVRTPKSSALRMSCARLIGWVWMQRSGSTPRRRTSCTSPVGRQIEESALLHAPPAPRPDAAAASGRSADRPRAAPAAACELRPHPLAVDDQQRRAELARPGGGSGAGCKRIDCKRVVRDRVGIESLAGDARQLLRQHGDRTGVIALATPAAARSRRSRIASQRSPSGTSCTRIRWQPAVSSARRLVYRSCAYCSGVVPALTQVTYVVRLQRQALRQHGDTLATARSRGGLRIDLARGHDGHGVWSAHNATAGCPARAAERIRAHDQLRNDLAAAGWRVIGPGPQQPHLVAWQATMVDSSPMLAFAAVENHLAPHRRARRVRARRAVGLKRP